MLDIAGMNTLSPLRMDKELFPNRVIVGTETFPTHIDDNWGLVNSNGHVIGDFTWTGWDYLGEVGIGRAAYWPRTVAADLQRRRSRGAAWCGDIDITGGRRPASYYRRDRLRPRTEPYIAVHRPETPGPTFYAGPVGLERQHRQLDLARATRGPR